MVRTGLIACLLGLIGASASAAVTDYEPSHAAWDRLLSAYVSWTAPGTATTVDYAGFARDSDALDCYLQSLSKVSERQFRQWGQAEREAFLINAYNAATVQLVLTRYPDLRSIKAIGGLLRSPWKQKFVPLLGRVRSLDEIEHELLRGAPDYADPRIHFAVNCASVGCPALRPEAYVGSLLRQQLEDQTLRFLSDRTRNRYDARNDLLRVSRIFDWYGRDFDSHSGGVSEFLARYAGALGLDEAAARRLRAAQITVSYLEYDWNLNRSQP
jgi:hypothetical protein